MALVVPASTAGSGVGELLAEPSQHDVVDAQAELHRRTVVVLAARVDVPAEDACKKAVESTMSAISRSSVVRRWSAGRSGSRNQRRAVWLRWLRLGCTSTSQRSSSARPWSVIAQVRLPGAPRPASWTSPRSCSRASSG